MRQPRNSRLGRDARGDIVAVFAVATLSACGTSLPEPEFRPQPESAFELAAFPPPPGRVETVPPAPHANAVWIDGEWRWTGTRYAWEFGRWVIPPKGARYAKWQTKFRPDGALLFAEGAFRDARGNEIPEPPALAVGRARSEGVTDPEGNRQRTAPNLSPDRPGDGGVGR